MARGSRAAALLVLVALLALPAFPPSAPASVDQQNVALTFSPSTPKDPYPSWALTGAVYTEAQSGVYPKPADGKGALTLKVIVDGRAYTVHWIQYYGWPDIEVIVPPGKHKIVIDNGGYKQEFCLVAMGGAGGKHRWIFKGVVDGDGVHVHTNKLVEQPSATVLLYPCTMSVHKLGAQLSTASVEFPALGVGLEGGTMVGSDKYSMSWDAWGVQANVTAKITYMLGEYWGKTKRICTYIVSPHGVQSLGCVEARVPAAGLPGSGSTSKLIPYAAAAAGGLLLGVVIVHALGRRGR